MATPQGDAGAPPPARGSVCPPGPHISSNLLYWSFKAALQADNSTAQGTAHRLRRSGPAARDAGCLADSRTATLQIVLPVAD